MAFCNPWWWLLRCTWWGATVAVEQPLYLIPLRAVVAIFTTINVLTSTKYHNSDKAQPASRANEIFWLKPDLSSVSWVLSSIFALWSGHLGFCAGLGTMMIVNFGLSAIVTALCFCVFERVGPTVASFRAEVANRAIMGVQFFGFFGYMVVRGLGTECAVNMTIWFVYLPGLLCYALNKPKDNDVWGAHDLFHASVLMGHLAAYGFDVANLLRHGGMCTFQTNCTFS